MIDDFFVDLSRFQFATVALYHFLFVPLTLGLTWILVIMESVYVMTGQQIYKDMTKFWGKLFGINFALGVTTGLTMEFQFGTNWAYYSHYVGDVFGAPLAIEGLMAFFLESTFVGMFFLGWDRLSKRQHLGVTFLTALGTNLSALWILVANGWMQNPAGSDFNYETMRMEMTSFAEIVLNPVAQVKFIHTVSAGYVTGAMFVMSISAYYLLKKRDMEFAKRSFSVAAAFGLASVLSVIVLGDESGYEIGDVQRTKLAAIEAEWDTGKAPASFTLFGFPDSEAMETHAAIKIPYLLGLIATRSFDEEVTGLKDIVSANEVRIRNGIRAYELMIRLKADEGSDADESEFQALKKDLGYGMLVKRYAADVVSATEDDIKAAATDTIPRVAPVFWLFRIMVAAGFFMLVVFALAFYYNARRVIEEKRGLLKVIVWSLPLPWIAIEAGWFVSEYGRQPWAIGEVLPTFLGTSTLTSTDIIISLIGFIAFYSLLAVIEVYLMVKFARLGPSSLHTGRYYFEKPASGSAYLATQPQKPAE